MTKDGNSDLSFGTMLVLNILAKLLTLAGP